MLEDNVCAVTQIVMITSQPIEGHKPFGKKPSESKGGLGRSHPSLGGGGGVLEKRQKAIP